MYKYRVLKAYNKPIQRVLDVREPTVPKSFKELIEQRNDRNDKSI